MAAMRIDDDEMRDLFRVESEEHLQRLDDGMLRLEKDPDDRAALDEVFREAHSLKGAARMLGLTAIETVSHCIEDILGGASRGRIVLCPELINRVCQGLDGLRELVREPLTGEDAGISPAEVLGRMRPRAEETTPTGIPVLEPEISLVGNEAPEPGVGEAVALQGAGESLPVGKNPEKGIEGFRIETMRVKTRDLDALMSHLAELAVSKIRIARRLADMDVIIGIWEEAGRKEDGDVVRGSTGQRTSSPVAAVKSRPPLAGDEFERLGRMLGELRFAAHEDAERLDFVANALEEGIRSVRLLPFSTIFNLFPRMVRDLAMERSREVRLIIEGGDTTSDKRIIEEMKDPLMHLIRNAVDHAMEPPEEREASGKPRCGTIILKASRTASGIVIEVRDDGRGLDSEGIRHSALKLKLYGAEELAAMDPEQIRSLIFVPGFSTSSFVTEVSGRGVGLDVVRNRVENLKGTIRIESYPGRGCVFRMKLPLTVATARVLIVMVNGIQCALPVEHVLTTCLVQRSDIFTVEGVEAIMLDGRPVSVAGLADLLRTGQGRWGRRPTGPEPFSLQDGKIPCVIISVGDGVLGLLVDNLLDEQEIVLKPRGSILKRVRNVSGAVLLGTGEVGIVLNPRDLVKSALKRQFSAAPQSASSEDERKKVILSADDSVITRTQMKRILEGAGYEVVSAVDGVDAYAKLGASHFDAVVSDVMMPNMNGLTLTAKIREEKRYQELPVILVTTLASQEDRKRGIEAGANAYIAKSAFDQRVLLDTLRRLV